MTGVDRLHAFAAMMPDGARYELLRIAKDIERETMPRPCYADGTPIRNMDKVEWCGRVMSVEAIHWMGDRPGGSSRWLVYLYDRDNDRTHRKPWSSVADEPLRRAER